MRRQQLCLKLLALAVWTLATQTQPAHAFLNKGAAIYREQCASCHGGRGEGVAGKYDETLYGERSIESLTRYIDKNMPEEDPSACVGSDAAAVAAYVHAEFYSQEARARLSPPAIDPARLTNRQYRESVADLVASFTRVRQADKYEGLKGEYYQSNGMNKKEKKVLERVDRSIAFDYAEGSPADGITAEQFSIAWNGSVYAPETGNYDFRVTTPNGARLYVNSDLLSGDANRRDDSAQRRQTPNIDLWVSAGGQVREEVASVPLLGGRSYPIRLDFFKFKDKTSSIKLEWRPPHGVWSVVGADYLSPDNSSSLYVLRASFPPDDASQGYERGTSISKGWHEATTRAALEAAIHIAGRLGSLAGAGQDDAGRVDKLKSFCATFAERAFRRPLTPELRAVYVDSPFAGDPAPEVAVKRSILLTLKSPLFLYPEMGAIDDAHLAATRLALVLWDSIPDQALLDAARSGALANLDGVRAQAERMMKDPRAKAKLKDFFHIWLPMEEGDDVSKDTKAHPGFDAALMADLRTSLERFVEEVVWSDTSNYRDLLLANQVYMNRRLADFYGVEFPDTDGFAPVSFKPDERSGVLTHPYLLTALSYYKSTSPIHRGVFLTRNVLGRFLKPPPMAIEFMDDRFDPSLTMREKVAELTKSQTCMACHSMINPLGFSLENFDAVGRLRGEDNNKPVQTEADYTTPEGETIRLRGARDVAEHAASSPQARVGFVRQLFQHSVKQAPAAYGADTLTRLDAQFARSGHHIRNLLVEIAATAATHKPTSHLASKP